MIGPVGWGSALATLKFILLSPRTGAFAFLIWFLVEEQVPGKSTSELNTLLLAGALGLLGWSLITAVKQSKQLQRIISALEGYDGESGLLGDIRDLKKAKEEQGRELNNLQGQVKQIRGRG